MHLALVDLVILVGYIAATLLIGFYIAKRASGSIRHYFLGGNEIPWYALGLSNASGMFDISGTMWMVFLLFATG
jgi:Na+/proline symporter